MLVFDRCGGEGTGVGVGHLDRWWSSFDAGPWSGFEMAVSWRGGQMEVAVKLTWDGSQRRLDLGSTSARQSH